MSERDPRIDPRPGDVLIFGPQWQQERYEVLEVESQTAIRLCNGMWKWSRKKTPSFSGKLARLDELCRDREARRAIMIQLLLHLIGDYVTQSDWMATEKTKSTWAAFVHATIYSLPFLLIGSIPAVIVIWSTHLLIDRFRLARYVVFAKNFMGWPWPKWEDCKATGYPSARPPWMAVWLLIVADNTLHLVINFIALRGRS